MNNTQPSTTPQQSQILRNKLQQEHATLLQLNEERDLTLKKLQQKNANLKFELTLLQTLFDLHSLNTK